MTAGWFSIQNDEQILLAEDRPFYHEDVRNMNRGDFSQMSLSVGITGTYAIRRFYCSAIVSIGGSIIQQRYQDIDGNRYEDWAIDLDFDYQFIVGYSGQEYFLGMWFFNENYLASIENLKIQTMNIQLSCFAGTRL